MVSISIRIPFERILRRQIYTFYKRLIIGYLVSTGTTEINDELL